MAKIGGYLVHEAAKLFPLMAGVEFEQLVEDIREKGLLEPIVLWKGGPKEVLLDGRNRLRACEKAGVKPRFTHYKGDDPTGYVVSHNLHRRHLDESQRGMVGARLQEVLEAEGKKRHREGVSRGGQTAGKGRPKDSSVVDPPQSKERRPPVRDQAARLVNVSGTTVQKARKVLQHGTRELVAAVDAGILKAELAAQIADKPKVEQKTLVRKIAEQPKKNARAIVRQHDRDQVSARIEAEAAEMPKGPFRVLMADPPWPYAKRAGDGTQRGQTLYPTMSLDDIVAWAGEKLRPIAHEDSVLWLWITNAHLVAGDHVAVLEAAGFTGKTILSWDKARMGAGDWLRGQTEHCILAVRGRPTVRLSNQTTLVPMVEEARREPSRKPEVVYRLVEELCPGNKVELFSRTDRVGWTSWGAEAGTFESELGL
ncbi:MAG: hypothetical protein GWN84_20860 [Gammaproteobacteria bacterium]|nr:hypothetical protein [Gammaproteobacteria bacterium]NIR85212.1 hypothetical protein [Gammaproteobacteria bacterium]NIU06262.1 hypothetical protein [Gammaproteobacteria bacterium]NIX87535.1 hypothetical protein [Gammaproteobacteria bacterium]